MPCKFGVQLVAQWLEPASSDVLSLAISSNGLRPAQRNYSAITYQIESTAEIYVVVLTHYDTKHTEQF